jgi:DNA polymerase III delta subunit
MSALRYSNQEIANASGIGAYFVGKTLNLSKNFTQKEVLDFLEKAADYDQKVKSGLIDSHFALELLIMEYMK